MTRYHVTPSAARDLEDIYEHVALGNLSASGRLLQRLIEAFEKLADMPEMGHFRDDLTDEPFRFWTVQSYLIIYRPDMEPLQILRVVSGSRDAARLLEEA